MGTVLKGYYVEVEHWDGKAVSWCGAWGAERQRTMRWKWSVVGMSSIPMKVWELILLPIFQASHRSYKPTTKLAGEDEEDAGRPGQPCGETTPADR